MGLSIILSGFVAFDGEINNSLNCKEKNSVIQQDLTSATEEADIRIIPHVSQTIEEKSSNIIILSNDTDGCRSFSFAYKKKTVKTISAFIFLIAAPQFRQKIFSEISFKVSPNPLHLQNPVQSISVFLHLHRLVYFDLHPHLTV